MAIGTWSTATSYFQEPEMLALKIRVLHPLGVTNKPLFGDTQNPLVP